MYWDEERVFAQYLEDDSLEHILNPATEYAIFKWGVIGLELDFEDPESRTDGLKRQKGSRKVAENFF